MLKETASWLPWAATVAAHRGAGVTYFGQKTHEKKVVTYLEKARELPFAEEQLMQLCQALEDLEKVRLTRDYVRRGQRRFPANPYFLIAEAELNLGRDNYWGPAFETEELLNKARELTTAMPRSERRQLYLDRIQDLADELRQLNPFANLFGSSDFMNPFEDGEEDFDDEFDGF
jgi:hypothetical protein